MSENIILKKTLPKKVKIRIKSGEILIYPTDTGYGIGCNALKSSSIELVKKISGTKDNTNISVIAPSKEWIYKNFKIKNKNYIKKLPGPFTFVLETKKRTLARNLSPGNKKIKVKMPDHRFYNMVKTIGIPILNIELRNKLNIVNPDHIPRKIKRKSDMIINDGYIRKSPSATINISKEIPSIIGG